MISWLINKCAEGVGDLMRSLPQFIIAGLISFLLFKYPQLLQVSATLQVRIFDSFDR